MFVCSPLLPVGEGINSVAVVATSRAFFFQVATWIEDLCISGHIPVFRYQSGLLGMEVDRLSSSWFSVSLAWVL